MTRDLSTSEKLSSITQSKQREFESRAVNAELSSWGVRHDQLGGWRLRGLYALPRTLEVSTK